MPSPTPFRCLGVVTPRRPDGCLGPQSPGSSRSGRAFLPSWLTCRAAESTGGMGMNRASPLPARGRLAGLVLRHRRLVAAFWLAVTAVGVLLAGQVTGRFSSAQELPGLPSYRAAEVLQHSYGIGNNPPIAVVVTLPAGERITSPAGRSDLGRVLGPVSADRSLRVVSYLSAGNPQLVSRDRTSTLALG